MSAEIHIGDIGTIFYATCKDENGVVINLSTATTKEFIFRRSDGSILKKAASFFTDGADGKLMYATLVGDLNMAGTWYLQVKIVFTNGTWHSDRSSFVVYANLPTTL